MERKLDRICCLGSSMLLAPKEGNCVKHLPIFKGKRKMCCQEGVVFQLCMLKNLYKQFQHLLFCVRVDIIKNRGLRHLKLWMETATMKGDQFSGKVWH